MGNKMENIFAFMSPTEDNHFDKLGTTKAKKDMKRTKQVLMIKDILGS